MKNIPHDNLSDYHEIEKVHNLLPDSNISSHTEGITFDEVLDRVGFGKYHFKLFVILGLLGMADGSESMVISFTVPVFKQHFNPSYDLEAVLGTAVYCGYFIGSLLSGYFSDKYGRRRPVIYSNILMVVLGLLSAFPPSLEAFIFLRALFGIIVGFFSPLAYTIMAEITPLKFRGKYMVLLGIFYTLGELVSCVVALFTLENLTSGDWHGLLAWSALPALIAWICSIFLLDESARHEMLLGNYSNGIRVLNKMYSENQGPNREPVNLMTQEEEEQLVSNYRDRANPQPQESQDEVHFVTTLKELFQGDNKKITPFVWVNWFANALTFFGLTYILPTTLALLDQEHNSSEEDSEDINVGSVAYASLFALPTVFVAAIVVDLKYLGRKNSLGFSFLLGGTICFIASLKIWPGFVAWISATKFFFSLAYTLNYQFTSELYPTKIRGTGIGIASAFGRIGSIIMPSVSSWIAGITTLAPYWIYGTGAVLAGIGTLLIPIDTTRLQMDALDIKF